MPAAGADPTRGTGEGRASRRRAEPGHRHLLGDILGAEDHEYQLVEARASIERAMSILDQRDRTILILYLHGNQTQAEMAGQAGISQMHVSRLRHVMDPGPATV